MIQKLVKIGMIVGSLLVIGLITTLIIRECQAENEGQKTEVVVNK